MALSDPPASTQSQPSPQQPLATTQKASSTDRQGNTTMITEGGALIPSPSGKFGEQSPADCKPPMFTRIRSRFHLKPSQKYTARTAWNGTKLLISVLKETSDAFPPLKITVSGLITLVDVFERTASNKSDMAAIAQHIERLSGMLAADLGRIQDRESLFVDQSYVETLNDHLSNLMKMKNEHWLLRVINSAQHMDAIKGVCVEIERALQGLQLNIALALKRLLQKTHLDLVLMHLKRAADAAYTAAGTSRRHCTPGTRDAVLKHIVNRVLDNDPEAAPVFWMSGLAGQGKTTIAYTICERLKKEGHPFVSFFCSRQLDSNKEKMLVSTIALELAEKSPPYAYELYLAVNGQHNLGDQVLDTQMSELLVEPWHRSLEKRVGLPRVVIVVDALDESEAGTEFIKLILAASREAKLQGLRILITSRPEPGIVPLCEAIGGRAICHLNDVPRSLVDEDILRYLNAELPDHRDEDYLVDVANASAGIFVYASTTIRMVKGSRRTKPEEEIRLRQLASRASSAEHRGEGILDSLYIEVIADAFPSKLPPGEKDARERVPLTADEKAAREQVLLNIVCADFDGVSDTLSVLTFCADADEELVRAVVDSLYPVLYIKDDTVFWHHASFQDYILATYKDLVHPTHMRIVRRCLIVWERLLDLAKDSRFTMRDEGDISRLQRNVAKYKEIPERDSPDWPTADDRNWAPSWTWSAFLRSTSLDHVELSTHHWEHQWKTVSKFLSSLRLEFQNASQDATG